MLAREGGSYRILLDGREHVAILRGKAKRAEDRAIAGDRVTLDPTTLAEETLAITGVEPRRSLLARRVPDGRGTRPVAANVDQVVVVIAAADPDPIPQLMDRLLVVAEANEIPCWVVVNKTDIGSAAPIVEHLRATGYRVLPTMARGTEGVEQLRAELLSKISVLTGPSGAGKSSLLNALEPGLGLRIGAVSAKVGRGTHTTVTATMIPMVGGGFVVDTPGFSEVGVWDLARGELDSCFPEFREFVGSCKYGDCLHRIEPGCAIRGAVEAGAIPAARHDSYLAILAELEALPESWE